jgi:precorrin-2 dehydrogenase/sirohydrochlorin ferrochelatase
MAYYPIALDITDRKALVVGGGMIALRKVQTLLDFGACVMVVSSEVVTEIKTLAESGRIKFELRGYRSEDITGAAIVIAATDNREVNTQVSTDAHTANIPVNVVDAPELCSFIVPSIVKRGDLTISINTAGKSPALARQVREKIEKVIGPEYSEFANLLGEIRELAKDRIADQHIREQAFKKILASEIPDLICSGHRDDARALALEILESFISSQNH